MLYRAMLLVFLVLGLTIPSLRAEEKVEGDTHEGKIVKIDGNKLTMTDKDGKNEHTHTLAADAKVMCDAKECKLSDLKPGQMVKVTTKKGDNQTALRVEANTKDK